MTRQRDGELSIDDILERVSGAPSRSSDEPIKVLIRHISLPDAVLHFEDLSASAPAAASIGPIVIDATDLSKLPDRRGSLKVDIALPGGGTIANDGDLALQPALAATGSMTLKDLDAAVVWPFLHGKLSVSTRYAPRPTSR